MMVCLGASLLRKLPFVTLFPRSGCLNSHRGVSTNIVGGKSTYRIISGKARDVQVSTNSMANNAAIQLDGDDDGGERFKSSRKLAYLPSLLTTYNLWYKRRWMTITRVQSQTGWYGSKEQTLFVRCVFSVILAT